MIRQSHVIERVAHWSPKLPLPTDTDALEAAWRDWAGYETIKRYVYVLATGMDSLTDSLLLVSPSQPHVPFIYTRSVAPALLLASEFLPIVRVQILFTL